MTKLDDFRDHVHACDDCSNGTASMCETGQLIASIVGLPLTSKERARCKHLERRMSQDSPGSMCSRCFELGLLISLSKAHQPAES